MIPKVLSAPLFHLLHLIFLISCLVMHSKAFNYLGKNGSLLILVNWRQCTVPVTIGLSIFAPKEQALHTVSRVHFQPVYLLIYASSTHEELEPLKLQENGNGKAGFTSQLGQGWEAGGRRKHGLPISGEERKLFLSYLLSTTSVVGSNTQHFPFII